ncbi:hypothetical protein FB45DRAFT_931670 [Roridomyces roridus]|uniref:F-box domain-containing protein n=1 Tax=Roridomyces roridus TaxID=1738132 RepID=A0AAD7BEL3_9AGAR|nr:hypothetical protein FB45DRAFT_931670 [Roridomyces roridus]
MDSCSRVLRITEIVRMICAEASERVYYPVLQPERLPILARTSKIFLEPALDLIWEKLPNLSPLIKCMPGTLWEERDKVIYLRRAIVAEDLPRLLYYSVRVKELSGFQSKAWRSARVDGEYLQALSVALTSQSLTPKLRSLWAFPTEEEAVPFLRHLLGPEMRKLTISLVQSKTSLSILPHIRDACPLLSELTLSLSSKVRQSSLPLFSHAICGLQHLKLLIIPNLDVAGFIQVSQLPFLEGLDLTAVVGQTATLHLPDLLPGSAFPALKWLHVGCDTPSFCAGFVQTISSPQFTMLFLGLRKSWTAVAWKRLLDTLTSCPRLGKLATIEITSDSDDRVPPEDIAQYTLTADIFRSFLQFREITTFQLQIYPVPVAGDEFLKEVAVAWPKLQTLQLASEVDMAEQPEATLSCLFHFARHCPKLESLGLRMSTAQVPTFTQVPGQRLKHPLALLQVGTSPIADDMQTMGNIAAFLSDLFPRLDSIRSFSETLTEATGKYATTWYRVSELYEIIADVRWQERRLARKEAALDDAFEEGSSTQGDDE